LLIKSKNFAPDRNRKIDNRYSISSFLFSIDSLKD
jgi:hypothetical protein